MQEHHEPIRWTQENKRVWLLAKHSEYPFIARSEGSGPPPLSVVARTQADHFVMVPFYNHAIWLFRSAEVRDRFVARHGGTPLEKLP